jgi:hypothetical protein
LPDEDITHADQIPKINLLSAPNTDRGKPPPQLNLAAIKRDQNSNKNRKEETPQFTQINSARNKTNESLFDQYK